MSFIPITAAILMVFTPIWMSYDKWRYRHGKSSSVIFPVAGTSAGWSIWAIAFVMYSGTLMCVLAAVFLIWVSILVFNRAAPSDHFLWRAENGAEQEPVRRRLAWRTVATNCLLMLGLAIVTTILLSLLMLLDLPKQALSRWLLTAMLFPVLWSTLTVWICVDRTSWRPPVTLLVLLGVTSLLLFQVEQ